MTRGLQRLTDLPAHQVYLKSLWPLAIETAVSLRLEMVKRPLLIDLWMEECQVWMIFSYFS